MTAAVVTAGGAGVGREYLVEVVVIRYQQVEKLEYLGSQRPVRRGGHIRQEDRRSIRACSAPASSSSSLALLATAGASFLAGSGRSAGTVWSASVRLRWPVSFGGVREVKQRLGDGPGLGGGDLRAHVGALCGGPRG